MKTPSVSEAIEFRQREFGWTQTRMAKALGLSTGHYSELMTGKRRLPYRAACLAYKLGVPASVLLNLRSLQPKRANVYGDRGAPNGNEK
jgi:transcriptional regulator with XRE-family HTH domain